MTSLSPPPAPIVPGELLFTRVSVNAPNAFMAAAAVSDYHLHLAQNSGLSFSEPFPRSLCEELRVERTRSSSSFLALLDQSEQGPVAGFWVTFAEARSPLFADSRRRLVDIRVERLPQPHRDPLEYGGYEGQPRDPRSLREETAAYWEAMDLQASLPAASSRAKAPGL